MSSSVPCDHLEETTYGFFCKYHGRMIKNPEILSYCKGGFCYLFAIEHLSSPKFLEEPQERKGFLHFLKKEKKDG